MKDDMKNPYYYIGANPTVDLIVQRPDGAILFIERNDDSPACAGMLALPGGFMDSKALRGSFWIGGLETPLMAALRELGEETSLILTDNGIFAVGIYEGNGRDPRDNEVSWSKSYAFACQLSQELYDEKKDTIKAATDAKAYHWLMPEEILNKEFAFDHKKIVMDSGLLNVFIKKAKNVM